MGTANVTYLGSGADLTLRGAAGKLVTIDCLNGRYRVGMPVALASGTLVDVSIMPNPDGSITVTDDGMAYLEATSIGISDRLFSGVAGPRCVAAGAVLVAGKITFPSIEMDRARGALISMAALVKEIVDEISSRHLKVRAESLRYQLFEGLDKAFPKSKIAHDVTVAGDSTAEHVVDATVETDGGLVVFDLFTRDPNSIAATFLKLSDIYRLDDAPRIVAVTKKPDAVGPKLHLISSIARVISADAAPDVMRRSAA